jgi:FixJ family two-component response regulator
MPYAQFYRRSRLLGGWVTTLRTRECFGRKVARISIIDDDLLVRQSTADLISSLGHEALIFASGEQFLASGCVEHTACIITDLHMPGMNGLELQKQLLTEGHRTPIIFITAYPKEVARSRALDAGAVAFLTKPFEESALIKSLETALNRFDSLQ